MEMENGKTYSVDFQCKNCGHKWTLDFDKGYAVKQEYVPDYHAKYKGKRIMCPNCECDQVNKRV